MSLARLAYFKVFNDSSKYVSAVVIHATMSVLLLPPSESCKTTQKPKCWLCLLFFEDQLLNSACADVLYNTSQMLSAFCGTQETLRYNTFWVMTTDVDEAT